MTAVSPSAVLLKAFNSNATYLRTQFNKYMEANITRFDFAKTINDPLLYGSVLSGVNSLKGDIELSVFAKLTSVIDSKQTMITDTYTLLLTKFNEVSYYVNNQDKTIENFVGN